MEKTTLKPGEIVQICDWHTLYPGALLVVVGNTAHGCEGYVNSHRAPVFTTVEFPHMEQTGGCITSPGWRLKDRATFEAVAVRPPVTEIVRKRGQTYTLNKHAGGTV